MTKWFQFRLVLILFCGILLCARAIAQNPNGSLRGTVQDSSGARVAGAEINVRNVALPLSREAHADARGEFRMEDVAPGSYQISVQANGFAEARAQVIIAVGSVREISVILQPNTISEKVTVTAPHSITAEQLDTASAVHQAIIYRQDLADIPLAARSFANISYLAPGTEPVEPSDPDQSTHHCRFHRRQFRPEQ